MNGQNRFLGRLAAVAYSQDEPIPGTPIIEIAGNRRVLIECHNGISQYTDRLVCVNVKFGFVQVAGESLEICRMTKDQLVISGCIDEITLSKGALR